MLLRPPMPLKLVIAALVLAPEFVSQNVRAQSQTFNDTAFDLAGYQVVNAQSPGLDPLIVRTSDGGNPGGALQILAHTPANTDPTNLLLDRTYAVKTSFAYDPAVHGEIQTIDVSIDKYTSTANPIGSDAATFLIYQAGNYFKYSIALPVLNGAYKTASQVGLHGSDFNLVTSLLGGATTNVHPNFTTGMMQFGFQNGINVPPNTAANDWEARFDNFSVSVHAAASAPAAAAAPASSSASLMLLALALASAGLVLNRRRYVGAGLQGNAN